MVVDKVENNLMSCVFWDEEEKKTRAAATNLPSTLFIKVKDVTQII
jgi:hypothetical protein